MSEHVGIQEVTKIIKAIIIIAGLFGVQISPENQNLITVGGAAAFSLLYSTEWWAKRQKRKEEE